MVSRNRILTHPAPLSGLTVVALCCLLCVPLFAVDRKEQRHSVREASPQQIGQLQNFRQLTDRVYVGGEPHGESDFSALAGAGIDTIVSVDGAKPDVALARAQGLRYIHIPFGYDAIPREAQEQLTKVMRTVPGRIYIHCHHGKHRGPAAAAVACLAAGSVDRQQARQILVTAGTSPMYGGLWNSVAAFEPPSPDAKLPELVEVAEVNSLAMAMASIDRARDSLLLSQAAAWKTDPNHPALDAAQEALIMREGFTESLRNLPEERKEERHLVEWLTAAEQQAKRLEQSFEAHNSAETDAALQMLENSCQQCHEKYRD